MTDMDHVMRKPRKPCKPILAFLLLSLFATQASARIRFEEARDYPATALGAGSGPAAATSADFNGDGRDDLAIADTGGRAVSVLLSQADGRFAPPQPYGIGGDAYSVASADLNRDGHADLVAASNLTSRLVVLTGQGDGRFVVAEQYPIGPLPQQVSIADFDRDGWPDLAALGAMDVTVLMNSGDGHFVARPAIGAGSGPTGIAAGEMDGDGIPDLAIGEGGSSQVTLLRGQGDGRFTPAGSYPVGGVVEGVASADLNGDGLSDVVTANAAAIDDGLADLADRIVSDPASLPDGSYGSDLSVLLADGRGGFLPQVSYLAGASPAGVEIADFDRDGHPDLVAAANRANTLVLLRGRGDGSFAMTAEYPVNNGPQSIAVGDFDDDGRLDLAAPGSAAARSVSVLRNVSVVAATPASGGGAFGRSLLALMGLLLLRRRSGGLRGLLPILPALALAACHDSAPAGSTQGAAGGSERRGYIEEPVASTAPDADQVQLSYVRLQDPLPAEVPEHPEACDWIAYLRFRDAAGPADATKADAILVAQAGVIGGASSFDGIARNTIRNAAAQGKHIEFWALERRSNCLEDHTGIEAAAAARDWRLAVDYYYKGKPIKGKTFGGFLTDAQVPMLAEIGLAQTMRDEYTVITRGIPDAAARSKKVFCGGHSMGGPLTSAFARWDFDGDPETLEDAGYKQCAGYFYLDTNGTLQSAELGQLEQAALDQLGPGSPDVILAGMRTGALPRIFDLKLWYGPEILAFTGILAQAAYQQADEVGLVKALPHSTVLDLNLRVFFSRDLPTFLSGSPGIRDFKLSNEALFGAMLDDNSQPLFGDQISLGSFDGGPVVQKDFPTPSALSVLSPASKLLDGSRPHMIPSEPDGPVYTWRNYDHVGDADAPPQTDSLGRPFTSPQQEVADIRQVARAFFEGPTDFTTHYESLRLVLDFSRAVSGDLSGDLSAIRHHEGPTVRPNIELRGGDNFLAAGASGPDPQTDEDTLALPGYTHIDVLSAAALQNDGKPERGAHFLASFVLHVLAHPGEPFPGRAVAAELE